MNKKENYLLFLIRYHANNLLTKFSKKKPHKYMMLIMGRYPSNIREAVKPVLYHDSEFRYSLGSNTISMLFESKLNIVDLDAKLKASFEGYAESFLIIRRDIIERDVYTLNMSMAMYRNLFSQQPKISPFLKLDELHSVVNVMIRSRNQFNSMIEEMNKEIEEVRAMKMNEEDDNIENIEPEIIDYEAELNRILEKVKATGFESLTETEKITLSKFSK